MREIKTWFEIDGDNTLRLDYPLTRDSLVWDVGGYKGEWAEKIYNKYGCQIWIFEPITEFFNKIVDRFNGNNNIAIYNTGLSDKTGFVNMSVNKDASSEFTGNLNERVFMIDIASRVPNVDLIKINIEGGEYPLLKRMIDTGIIINFNFIQVQFHNFIEDAESKRDAIRQHLSQTHDLMWNYDFIWESWKRKPSL